MVFFITIFTLPLYTCEKLNSFARFFFSRLTPICLCLLLNVGMHAKTFFRVNILADVTSNYLKNLRFHMCDMLPMKQRHWPFKHAFVKRILSASVCVSARVMSLVCLFRDTATLGYDTFFPSLKQEAWPLGFVPCCLPAFGPEGLPLTISDVGGSLTSGICLSSLLQPWGEAGLEWKM